MKFLFHLTSVFMIVASVALTSCAGLRHKEKTPAARTQSQSTAATKAAKKPDAKATKPPAAATQKTPAVTAPKNLAAPTAQTSKPAKSPFFSFARLLPVPGVQVVKVREKDLKELPTGHERALAFESQRKRGFWFFGGPVDFKEPTLPVPGSALDGSLLPPRIP